MASLEVTMHEDIEASELDSPGEMSARQKNDPSKNLEMRANMGRERIRKTRGDNNQHLQKSKSKNVAARRTSASSPRDFDVGVQARTKRTVITQSQESSSSSEDESDHREEDRRKAVGKLRLTSPSVVSSMTNQTIATNKSNGSSGSNSTIKQSSFSKRAYQKKVEVDDGPSTPAAPDPPGAISFVDNSPPIKWEPHDIDETIHEAHYEADKEGFFRENIIWPKPRTIMESAYQEPLVTNSPEHVTTSSSASDTFHGDSNPSEQASGHETDPSTSPERSDQDNDPLGPSQPLSASDQHSAKFESQIAAARLRQNSWGVMQPFGTPDMPHGNVQYPHLQSSVLSARPHYQVAQRPLPRAETLPITGYELLASKISSSTAESDDEQPIKPIYRKFEALNHRILLHLQDELGEMEEQLHRLDHSDTQSRRIDEIQILPASRRAGAQIGGELEWHKTDILGRIGFKLNQYNQALASFNGTLALPSPDPADIDNYREYLYAEQPISENETRFLDPEEDLVTVSRHRKRKHHRRRRDSFDGASIVSSTVARSAISSRVSALGPQPTSPTESYSPENLRTKVKTTKVHGLQTPLPIIIASAVACAIILPVISFLVVSVVIARVLVTILVAAIITAVLLYFHLVDQDVLLSQENGICVALYGGVMLVIAGVMA